MRLTSLTVDVKSRDRIVGRVNGRPMAILDLVRNARHTPTARSDRLGDYDVVSRPSSARLTPAAARVIARAPRARALGAGAQLGLVQWRAALYRATMSLRTGHLAADPIEPGISQRPTGIFTLPVKSGALSPDGSSVVALGGALHIYPGQISDLVVDIRPDTRGLYGTIAGQPVRIAVFDPPAPRLTARAVALALEPTLTAEGSEALLRASEPRFALTSPAALADARAEPAPGADFAHIDLVAPTATTR